MLTRRHFIQTTTALFSASISSPLLADTWPTDAQKAGWDAQVTPPGYDPATSLEEGLRATVAWFRENWDRIGPAASGWDG